MSSVKCDRVNKPSPSRFSRDDVLTWLNESLLPRLLDDSALLRATGSVLLGALRLRQTCDTRGETSALSAALDDNRSNTGKS